MSNSAQNGKGSKPRPLSINLDEYADRWDQIFGKKKKKVVKPQPPTKTLPEP